MTRIAAALVVLSMCIACVSCATPQAAPQPTPMVIVVTQIVNAPTLAPLPTYTPYPTYTPAPPVVITATPAPATETPRPAATSTTTPTAQSATGSIQPAAPVTTSAQPSAKGDEAIYTALIGCTGTNLSDLLVGNSVGEIIEGYKRDKLNFLDGRQCIDAYAARAAVVSQKVTCVEAIALPVDATLKQARQYILGGLVQLRRIRVELFGTRICSTGEDSANAIWGKPGREAFDDAQNQIKQAQVLLDQYRREHGK